MSTEDVTEVISNPKAFKKFVDWLIKRADEVGVTLVTASVALSLVLVATVVQPGEIVAPETTQSLVRPVPGPPSTVTIPDLGNLLDPPPEEKANLPGPLPTDRALPLSDLQIQNLMVEAGFPYNQIGTGVAIAKAESSARPNATNSKGNSAGVDRGLWQINDFYWKDELALIDWSDPVQNTKLAFDVWSQSGWDAWTTYKPGEMDNLPPPAPNALPKKATIIPCTTQMFGGTKPNVVQAAHLIAGAMDFRGTIGGYSARDGSFTSDHETGLALDFMTGTDKELGWRIAAFVVENAAYLNVTYVIFDQQINMLDGKGWTIMEDRGNPTANHADHPHISFREAPANLECRVGWVAAPPKWN